MDYHNAYLEYARGASELPGSMTLYVRAVVAYIQYFSREHPLALLVSLFVVLASLFASLYFIHRALRQ